jgi:hypothetical protein
MLKEIKLTGLYCAICHYYDTTLATKAQRVSNNDHPLFTDAEALTIFIFGLSEEHFTVKSTYRFVQDYFSGWFPRLPSYQAYNHRICRLHAVFQELCCLLITARGFSYGSTFLLDSMPIVVANARRSGHASVASGLCAKTYCASQDMWYYGVKLHILGQKVYHSLPLMTVMQVTPANRHDLTVAKEILSYVRNITLFADKAYCDVQWQTELREKQGITIYTPVKLEKGQTYLRSCDNYFSQLVSKAREAIESFFNWLNEKTHIQSASKVRSEKGLISFIFARLAVAAFYP